MNKITTLVCALFCCGTLHLIGADSITTDVYHQTLSSAPSAELPAKAAEIIKGSKSRELESTTVKVVKLAVEINSAAAPATVGAIARAMPNAAAVAAATAAEQQPMQASAIARSAAAAAPSKVGKIVAAVCRVVPNRYRNIAVAVSEAVPGSEKIILEAVASAVPDLKPYIVQVLVASSGKVASIAVALDEAYSLSQTKPTQTGTPTPTLAARGPAVGPPYIPLSGTPANVNPGNSGEVPPGGRGYAAP